MTLEGMKIVVDCGGVKLHCAIAGETRGELNRPLMLFLHGFPEFWAAWRTPMAHFAARGWRRSAGRRRSGRP